MKIPKQIYLLGHKWEVKILSKGDWPYEGEVGATNFPEMNIEILQGPNSFMEHTYLHELVHACLQYMGETDLDKNERFIDLLSGLIHQAMTLEEGE